MHGTAPHLPLHFPVRTGGQSQGEYPSHLHHAQRDDDDITLSRQDPRRHLGADIKVPLLPCAEAHGVQPARTAALAPSDVARATPSVVAGGPVSVIGGPAAVGVAGASWVCGADGCHVAPDQHLDTPKGRAAWQCAMSSLASCACNYQQARHPLLSSWPGKTTELAAGQDMVCCN